MENRPPFHLPWSSRTPSSLAAVISAAAICCCPVFLPQLLTSIALLHGPAPTSEQGLLPPFHWLCLHVDRHDWTAAAVPRALTSAACSAGSAIAFATTAEQTGSFIAAFPFPWFNPHCTSFLYKIVTTLLFCIQYLPIVIKITIFLNLTDGYFSKLNRCLTNLLFSFFLSLLLTLSPVKGRELIREREFIL